MKKQKQQGDVLFLRIKSLPEGIKEVKPRNGKYILAEGEATGHAHAIVANTDVQLYERDNVLYLSVSTPAVITHEEHKEITVEEGIWEVGGVVEIDPFEEEIRRVMD